MKKIDLKDKVIWITGASSGIGASLAIQLNTLGAKVIASARRVEKLTEIKNNCPNPHHMRFFHWISLVLFQLKMQ